MRVKILFDLFGDFRTICAEIILNLQFDICNFSIIVR